MAGAPARPRPRGNVVIPALGAVGHVASGVASSLHLPAKYKSLSLYSSGHLTLVSCGLGGPCILQLYMA